jgi:HlyD family secretion protein
MWMNPDLKVYNAEIYLDSNDTTLRTGMSCKAEMVVEQYEDASFIPVQAVLRVGGETTAYVVKDKTIEPRSVQIGLDNNRMVRIINGLQEGELVLLTPPLKSAEVGASEEKTADQDAGSEGNNDAIYESINDKLRRRASGQPQTGSDRPENLASDRESFGQKRKKGRQFESMSAEERKKMRERFQKMSPEDRDRMKRRRQGGKR